MNSNNDTKQNALIGTDSQKALYRMYQKFVSKSKAQFFKSLGLGVIQGQRNGIYIKTLEGNRKNHPPMELIDCRTSGGVFNLGHRHPAILQALREGIEGGLDIGDHHLISEQRALLGKKLADLMPPGITQTQYCVGGGEAIDLALKLARATTQRKKVISAKNSYHGVTGLAMAAGAPKFKRPFFGSRPDFVHVEFGNISHLEDVIDDQTACVILETIPATGGILIAPPGYFSRVRELCDIHGAVLIADEVQAGLGRTGTLWGIYGGIYPEEKVIPDIIVLGKGMSAGIYPLTTVSYKPFLGKIFEEDPFIHISSTGGAELGCYITRKMLEIQADPSFLKHVNMVGNQLGKGLSEFKTQFPDLIVNVRGRGLMWGIEFINERYGLGYTLEMIRHGIFADYCGNHEATIKLMPPLIIKKNEVDMVLKRLMSALQALPKPNTSDEG